MIENEHTSGFYAIESFRAKCAYEDSKQALRIAQGKYEYDLKLLRLLGMYKSRHVDRSMIGARVLTRRCDVEVKEEAHIAAAHEYLNAAVILNRQQDIIVPQAEDMAYKYMGWSPVKRFLFDLRQKFK